MYPFMYYILYIIGKVVFKNIQLGLFWKHSRLYKYLEIEERFIICRLTCHIKINLISCAHYWRVVHKQHEFDYDSFSQKYDSSIYGIYNRLLFVYMEAENAILTILTILKVITKQGHYWLVGKGKWSCSRILSNTIIQ